jgi:signal transduction histidine kinase
MNTDKVPSSLSILLVEDNEHDRQAFRRAFQKNNVCIDLTECVRAEEALERIKENPSSFDLVVTDHNLPGMSGLEFCQELLDRKISLPLVILTGGGSEHLAVEALKAGVDDYLIKDTNGGYLNLLPTVLPEVVQRYHDRLARRRAEEALVAERALLAERVRERTAELSKANAELSRAVRLKDEFLTIMRHELRTPLNVILGMSGALQEETYGTLNERQHSSLRRIEEGGRRLLALITDILDLSEIGAGKFELNITPVPVESVCQSSLQFLNQAIRKKQLKLSTMFDSTVEIIHADERRLKQVLVNLLSNAVKFTPEGGRIGLNVEGDIEKQVVCFTVWDTGIGIASEDIKHLFLPFMQLDRTLSRKYEGAGLGLSLVYHIANMHGGSISVESKIDKGSRFTVSLPWQESRDEEEMGSWGDRELGSLGDEASKDSPSPPSPSSQSAVILIAEDHEATIAALSWYLSARGYQLTIARNGKETIERMKEDHPDLILMDIQMPEMDGLDVIRHIRANEKGKSIPIIAVTALAMPGDRERCLAVGADEYICKPVNLKELSEVLEQFLRGRR